jgi:hypothetical protein
MKGTIKERTAGDWWLLACWGRSRPTVLEASKEEWDEGEDERVHAGLVQAKAWALDRRFL